VENLILDDYQVLTEGEISKYSYTDKNFGKVFNCFLFMICKSKLLILLTELLKKVK